VQGQWLRETRALVANAIAMQINARMHTALNLAVHDAGFNMFHVRA
jgi:hypothetical protein